MKIAFISGINYPRFVKEGSIAFTLSDWIIHNKEYTSYYASSNMYKITDNMAAENGISSPIDQVLSAARAVHADEVWASDKLYDKKETIKLTKTFLKSLKPYDNFKIVGLPQGKTMREWLSCYKWMLKNPKIDVIALSKYSVPKCFEKKFKTNVIGKVRPLVVKYLHEKNLIKKPLHLAGADNFIIHEVKSMLQYPLVRSIDSNICFKLGVHKIMIDKCEVEPDERLNHNITDLNNEQLDIIRYNINKVKEIL